MESVRKIYTVGEALVDIIFSQDREINKVAGGAVVNSSITLGRLGLPVSLVSEMGVDSKGDFLVKFMKDNHVNTQLIQRYSDRKTAYSHAYLNEKNEATYEFFKDPPNVRELLTHVEFNMGDILLFGSWFALDNEVHDQVMNLVRKAKVKGCLVLYDPNFRKMHIDQLESLKPIFLENISTAGMMRASDEDFLNIFGAGNSTEAYSCIKDKCPVMVYTSGEKGVFIHTPNYSRHFPVPKIQPVSTIGAGDNFNAGIIYALVKNNVFKDDLPGLNPEMWEKIIGPAIRISAEVCKSLENFIPVDFVDTIKTER